MLAYMGFQFPEKFKQNKTIEKLRNHGAKTRQVEFLSYGNSLCQAPIFGATVILLVSSNELNKYPHIYSRRSPVP